MANSITIQDAADVMATMQQLLHKAETGQDASEEQVALRMLGSVFETPENPIGNMVTASSGSNGVSVMAPGGDKFDTLVDELMSATKPAAQVVADGKVPSPPVITVVPKDASERNRYYYQCLQDAGSLCALYTKMLQVKAKPNGFDITTEAPTAFEFIAKTTNDVMMGPLAGFYNFAFGSRQTYNNTIARDQVHENLIGKVFAPFKFDDDTKKQLDLQLTTFVGGIKNVNTQKSPTNTLDFCLILNLIPKVNVSGDPNDKDGWLTIPCTYLILMKIKASSFQESVKKNTSVDKVTFEFALTITKCELNTQLFEANRPKFDKIFEALVGENLKAFTQKLAKGGEIQSNQPNPGANVQLP